MIRNLIAGILLVAFVVGCGGGDPKRKETFPVKGKLTVDGQVPGSALQIECHHVAGVDTNNPTASMAESDPEGNFSIATYEAGDGVPAGDYVLTIKWMEFNLMTRSYSGDKLNGRYADPAKSEIKISVKGDSETDLGVIDLKTK